MRRAPVRWALAVTAALGLCGCTALGGGGAPHGAGGTQPSSAATTHADGATAHLVARANRAHEVPTPARPQRAARGWATPQAAVRAFAREYVNWTAATVAARLRSLARDCVGQARAMLQLQAGEVAGDAELQRGRIANSGTVEALGPLAGTPHRYAVVTRERTTAADDAAYRGLVPAWHVSVATVTRIDRRWLLSGWQPES